jgi:hypothetical protein
MMKSSASSVELQVRREAAFVADIGVVAGRAAFLEGVEDLRPMRTASAHAFRADRHDHEFLDVDRVVGVRAAIDDVHHRHGRMRGATPPT